MGLLANDSHLWNMCATAEWGQLRWDISEAWASQPGCTHRLHKAAAGVVLLQAGGIRGSPEIWAFQFHQHPREEGPGRDSGARLTEAG